MNRKKINIIKLFFFGIIAVSLLGACKDKQPYADFDFSYATDPKIEFINYSISATSYMWNFGDGKTSTAFSPTHTYTSNGTYTVSLIAKNTKGESKEVKTVTITKANNWDNGGGNNNVFPKADFECYPHDSNFTVRFVNKSTNANSYLWNFGDGKTSTAVSPSHTYVSRGIKRVTLTASNDYGYETVYMDIDMSSKIKLTNNSSNPYSVTIDGVSKGNIAGKTTQTYEVNPGRHSVYVKQQSGYLFYPTENTYSIVCYAGKTTSQSVLN